MYYPKRRRDKYNPYYLSFDESINKYFILFDDNKKNKYKVAVNYEIYNEFNKFELEDISQMNKYDNHIEHKELTDEVLYNKMFIKEMSIEKMVEKKLLFDEIEEIINTLPYVQKRRIKKYFFEEKTFQQITYEENCTKRAIKFSVDIAIQKIKKNLKL